MPSASSTIGSRLSQSLSVLSLSAIDVDDFLENLSLFGSAIFPKLFGDHERLIPKYIAATPNAAAVHKAKPAPSSASYNILSSQNISLKRRLRLLEADNLTLNSAVLYLDRKLVNLKEDQKQANMMLNSDFSALDHEITELQAEYYTQVSQGRFLRKRAKADNDELLILRDKLAQAERFILAMAEINLHEPVFCRASQAFNDGEDVENALIDSIKDASNKTGSAWSRIIPAIVGPRTPDHYLAAINLTLKTRRELQERERALRFWKQLAQMTPNLSSTVTPSPSSLSDIDDLIPIPIVEELAEAGYPPHILEDPFDCSPNGDDTICKSKYALHVSCASGRDTASVLNVTEGREKMTKSLSTPSMFVRPTIASSQAKPIKPPLEEVVLNRTTDTFSIWENVVETPTKSSAKALGKRRGSLMTRALTSPVRSSGLRKIVPPVPDDLLTLTQSKGQGLTTLITDFTRSTVKTSERVIDLSNRAVGDTKLPTSAQQDLSDPFTEIKVVQLAEPPIIFSAVKIGEVTPQLDPLSPVLQIALHSSETNPKRGSLLAVQALQSLDRICAAFSSDTLGSLEMTDDETASESESESHIHKDSEVPLLSLGGGTNGTSPISSADNGRCSGGPTTPQNKNDIDDQDATPKAAIPSKFVTFSSSSKSVLSSSTNSPSPSKIKQPFFRSAAAMSKVVPTRGSTLLSRTIFRDSATTSKASINRAQQYADISNRPLPSIPAQVSPPPDSGSPCALGAATSQAGVVISPNHDPLTVVKHPRKLGLSQPPLADPLKPFERRIKAVPKPTQPLRIIKKSGQSPSPVTKRQPLSNITNLIPFNPPVKSLKEKSKASSANTISPDSKSRNANPRPIERTNAVNNDKRTPTAPKTRSISRIASPVISPASTRPVTRCPPTRKSTGSDDYGSITIIRNTQIDSPHRTASISKPAALTSIPKLNPRRTQKNDSPNNATSTRPKTQPTSPNPPRPGSPAPSESDKGSSQRNNPHLGASPLASRGQQVTWAVEVLATKASPTPLRPTETPTPVHAQSSFQVDAKSIRSPLTKLRMSLSPSSGGFSGISRSSKMRGNFISATHNNSASLGTTFIGHSTIATQPRGILRRLSAAIS